MHIPSPDPQSRAVLLAAIAGMVDVVAFLSLGGFFVSFMSGNTTRLAIGVTANWWDVQLAASLILSFVGGVAATAYLRARWPGQALSMTLGVVTAALVIAAFGADYGLWWPMLVLAAGMGAINTAFEAQGGIRLGLTYMTGSLVQLGHAVADWLVGRGIGTAWQQPALLWTAFLAGGMMGVGLYARLGLLTLWVPAALCAILTALCSRDTATAKEQHSPDQH